MVVAFAVWVAMLLVDTGVAIEVAKAVARDVMVICGGGIGSVSCIVGGRWQGRWQSWSRLGWQCW
jgi:hypothetical protein